MVGYDGKLYPAGSLNFSVAETADTTQKWNESGSEYPCIDENKGIGCTARLIENNYQIDY